LAQSGLAIFSIGMAYPFLNIRFQVGVGQRGFLIKRGEMRWEKSVQFVSDSGDSS